MKKLLACSLFVVCACASQPSSDFQSGDAENAIRKANAELMTAFRSGDANAVANVYAADAMVLAANTPAVRSRDAIRTFFTHFLGGAASIDVTLTTSDVQQSGDLAVETGQYVLHITPKNAALPVTDQGKYLVAWRKIEGQWKITRDAFNSDLAAPR